MQGITLGGLSAISTDENGKPKFIEGVPDFVHKALTLDSLAAYFSTV